MISCRQIRSFRKIWKKALRKKHVLVKNVWVMDKIEGRRQIFLNLRARSGQCVSMTEIAQILSRICGSSMTPDADSRSIVNGDFRMVHFVEDVSYQMLYGVARLTREAEKVFWRQLYLSSGRGWQVFSLSV